MPRVKRSTGDPRPVLWHLGMSHFNEKARWAFDFKRIPHVRRAVMPGLHSFVARRMSGRPTFPIVEFGDEIIGDSSAIVARLEEMQPSPALYPTDPELFARAKELERQFDKVLAPAVRRAVYQEVLKDRELTARLFAVGANEDRRRLVLLLFTPLAAGVRSAFRVPPDGDPGPRDVVVEHLDQIESLTAEGGYLVGDSFTVADLAACSFLIPLINPDAMPQDFPPLPPSLADFSRQLAATPGGKWIAETYTRHRNPGVPASRGAQR